MNLATARLYLVAPVRIRAGHLADLVPELAAAGVDIVQLRDKEMDTPELLENAHTIGTACRQAGAVFIVNDHAVVARTVEADGVHVGQEDLSVDAARAIVGPEAIVGLSTHSREQIDTSDEVQPDYIAVGPVFETPTKPGRPSVGLELLSYAAERVTARPWFAIGGIDRSNIEDVVAAGATRIVVVRAITEATDPIAAAAGLRALMPG